VEIFAVLQNKLIKTFENEKVAVPVITTLLVILAYGLLAPWLGFYWDDQPFAWLLRFFGPGEFIAAFRPFRPLLGPIFTVTTTLFGGHPLTWQIIGLVTRVLLSLSLWYTLRLTWPFEKWNLAWVVFLFTVYPAYQQQWVALTHVNQEMIPLLFLICSFAATAASVRNERYKKHLTALALFLQILGLFSTEYFFGLEVLRFFFLFAIFTEAFIPRKDAIRKTMLHWSPYLFVWIVNAAWTYAYHQSAAYNSYQINALSGVSLSPLALLNEFINTILLSGFIAWLNAFNLFSVIDGTLTQIIALAIMILTGVIVFVYMKSTSRETVSDDWSWQAMLTGLIAIFAGRLPSWAAGLPLKIEFDYDRFMISIMLGASLFIVGLATFILKDGKRKNIILSLLVGSSVAYQFSVANTFRRDWDNEQRFFWELTWRIPAMQKGTALLTYELPLKYASDMQVTAPLNWAYAPDLNSREMPYMLAYIKSRYNSKILPSLKPNTPIDFNYRTAHFSGSTSNSIVIYKDADGCLRVLDPVYGSKETVLGASYFLTDAIPLSNPDLIQTGAPQPELDKTIFGSEPAHDWCYYYAKAELARQESNWGEVVNLYKQAHKGDFTASIPVENLPFIEAFARTGQTDEALKLTDVTVKTQKELCPAVLTLWERVSQNVSVNMDEVNAQIKKSGCK
jgi:hypothetical protein